MWGDRGHPRAMRLLPFAAAADKGAFLTGRLSCVRIACVSVMAKSLSLFREQCYWVLTRNDATLEVKLGKYRA
jgi:hypothetical protein